MTLNPRTVKQLVGLGTLALALGVRGAPSLAQVAPDTAVKLACQLGTSRWLGKEAIGLQECWRACVRRNRDTPGSGYGIDGCFFPPSDAGVDPCIVGVLSETKAAIAKDCTQSCPACYESPPAVLDSCPDGGGLALLTWYPLNQLARGDVFCFEGGLGLPTRPKPSARRAC
jgi:hypothetical protein